MNGLVQEWCADHWVKDFADGRAQSPLVLEGSERHVVRGGSWFTESDSAQAVLGRLLAARSEVTDWVCDWFGNRWMHSPPDASGASSARGRTSNAWPSSRVPASDVRVFSWSNEPTFIQRPSRTSMRLLCWKRFTAAAVLCITGAMSS